MSAPQLTRAIVVISTVVAALAEAYLATEYSQPVFWIAVLGFALLLIAGERLRSSALPVLMAAMYLMPAVFLAVRGGEDFSLDVIWILPLLGLILSGRGAWQWSLPSRWQWPLITWAMLVAVTWPIVFLREADFALWILPLERVSNTSVGIGPWEVGKNIGYFAIGHNVGILFIDALFRWYAGARDRFRREVLPGLALAAALAAIVSFYQGFVDLAFLNRGFWAYMIRASGTLADPNKLGAVTAFWTIGGVVLARRMPRPWSAVVSITAIALGAGAVWLCGSRTGLAAVMVSVTIAAWEGIRYWRSTRGSAPIDVKRLVLIAAGVLALAIALVVLLQHASTHTVIARGTWTYIPFYGDKGIKASINELLWERFGYGPAAIQMVKEHPIEGIGVGTFHALVIDFAKVRGYSIPTDNAQSWFRHNIAELGLAGSIPILWWCFVFAKQLFRKSPTGDRLSIGMLRSVLIGFFVASLFGMPAQSIAILMTFWVFVFWFTAEQQDPNAVMQPASTTGWSRPLVIAAAVLIGVHAGATVVDAFGDLRPRERAQRFNWYYRYGFHINDSNGYDLEPDPGGNPIGRRWTTKTSLAVIPVKGKVLKFVAWVDHPDKDIKPVHTQVWADSRLVYEGDLRGTPLFLDIPATPGKTHMVIETSIDRLFRPSDANPASRDSRELGLSIRDWTWE